MKKFELLMCIGIYILLVVFGVLLSLPSESLERNVYRYETLVKIVFENGEVDTVKITGNNKYQKSNIILSNESFGGPSYIGHYPKIYGSPVRFAYNVGAYSIIKEKITVVK